MKNQNILIACAIVILTSLPLFICSFDEGFSATDQQAQKLIEENNPNYKAWFNYIWRPPNAEMECLFFSLQSAIGAGVLGYYIGLTKGRSTKESR